MATDGAPRQRSGFSLTWTGSEAIVWGGFSISSGSWGSSLGDGAAYNPAADTWRPLPETRVPQGRFSHDAAWTGHELLIWGGHAISVYAQAGSTPRDSGAYIPSLNAWEVRSIVKPESRLAQGETCPALATPETGWTDDVPLWVRFTSGGLGGSWVWTGSEVIVWGGAPDREAAGQKTGVGYCPANGGAHTPTQVTGAPAGRFGHAAVWTGQRMLIWGGTTGLSSDDDGSAYDPVADTWARLPSAGAPHASISPIASWTGTEMLVWVGNSGAAYTPAH
jgi:hypothetical protein